MLATLWLRPLWQRPRRALATVLGVAVGVASVLATALASRAAVASLTDDVDALAGAARIEVTRPGGVPLADLGRLAPVAGEVWIAPVVEGTALVPARGESVRLLGVDGIGAGAAGWSALAGHGFDALGERFLREPATLLARGAAARLGVGEGDVLELVVQARRVELTVLGTFEPERMASAWERVLLVDVALAQELLGRPEFVDRLELVPRASRAGADEERLAALAGDREERLAARVRALLPEGYRVGPASLRRAEGERLVRSLTFNLTALAGVSVLVAIVLVATTLATSVVQRRPVIALLRSLGASRAQLAWAVLLESALIGLAGGALGVGLGWLGARAIAADVHGSFATLSEDVLLGAVRLEPAWAFAGLAIGLGSALVAAFLPLREAWNTPPLQHLRLAGIDGAPVRLVRRALAVLVLAAGAWASARLPPWNERPIWALVSTLLLLGTLLVLSGPLIALLARAPAAALGLRLGTPLRLAQAALASARTRAAWAASAVGVAIALAVAMTTMVGSFRASVVDWTTQTLRSDLFVRPLANVEGATVGRIAPEVLALVERRYGRDGVDPYFASTATVDGKAIMLCGAAFEVSARQGGLPFLDERDPRAVFRETLARGCALANEPFARRFDLWAGDRVRITTSSGTIEREIGGVYRDYSAHTGRLVLDQADFFANVGEQGAESIEIYLPDGADVESERARLETELAGAGFALEVLDNPAVHAEVLRIFERTFSVTVALQWMAALVAALAVVLVLTALVRERVRELSVVRVLGGSRVQLFGLVAAQALLLGAAGAVGGAGVGLVVGWVLVTVLNVQSFGWSLSFTLPRDALWSTLLVLPTCLAAGWLPAWLALRARPQEALREPD